MPTCTVDEARSVKIDRSNSSPANVTSRQNLVRVWRASSCFALRFDGGWRASLPVVLSPRHNLSRIRSDKGLYQSGQGSQARFGCPEDEMDTFPKGNHIVLTGDSFFGMNASPRDQTCIPLPSLENSSPLENCYLVGEEGEEGGERGVLMLN